MITLTVHGNNWGTGRHADISAVLRSAEAQIAQHLREDVEATINVARWDKDPEARRGVGGAQSYKIWLSAKDRYWAQYTYQFAHELCHVVAGYGQRFEKPNQWFEESICEVASLFTLRSMGVAWKEEPPYPNWAPYGASLLEYARATMAQATEEMPNDAEWKEWMCRHDHLSRTNPYERIGNRIIALRMLPLFEDYPQGWNAIQRLPTSEVRIGAFLAQWAEAADPRDRDFVQRIEGALVSGTVCPPSYR